MFFAGKDPVRNAVPAQEVVYETIQALWSAWARRRNAWLNPRIRPNP